VWVFLTHNWERFSQPPVRVPSPLCFPSQRLYSLETGGAIIHSLCFSPNRYWLCAATSKNITIWDLESKGVVAELTVEREALGERDRALAHFPTCLAWSADGTTLYAGYTDNVVRIYAVSSM
jgi:guanine nucleotide-binding protein subunit beta-2-like 1 protein